MADESGRPQKRHRSDERLKRSKKPGTYSFRIENYSLLAELLQKTGDDSYDSLEFEAGGHKWYLSLYPGGYEAMNGKGCVSLYLVLAESEHLRPGWEIDVELQMFVFDHIEDDYLVIEDKKVRRFHETRREWGFAQLLKQDEFKDPQNGYLFEDCCEFGVEVVVLPSGGKSEIVDIKKNPEIGTYTWRLPNFSNLEEDVDSLVFTEGSCQWKLLLFRNGVNEAKGKGLSMFLKLCSPEPHAGLIIFVECTLSVIDQVRHRNSERTFKHWFDETSEDWGYENFMALRDLKDKTKGYLLNDTLIVEAKFNLLSIVRAA